ncbi:MAG: hypothetical protein DRR06_10890 [Gammaproteobacteria bacterium]|nr:MAG: hypothetical protein DRR06_10890 [Gammaproteobacteria bacterium]RLA49900.1 MAG: hypothetical protein DRR42_14555 [Gammaproteobacteria bacterium]
MSRPVSHRNHRQRFTITSAALLIAITGWGLASQSFGEASGQENTRPRIGLVLAGGGARGAAHIGVLKVLEQMRIPVDCIAGTSMGALVGATYATGMPATEIERIVLANDWAETFTKSQLRLDRPMQDKLAGLTYSNNIEFGIQDGSIIAPGGFVSSQGIDEMIRSLVASARATSDFQQLPIPFRAIATDLHTGDMVVFERGDLALAMRASMAIPGIFSPVKADGRLMIDGGIVRNLPVDVARSACADIVIAVKLESPAPSSENMVSALQITARTIDVVIKNNERTQWQSLTPTDIGITVNTEDMGSGQFNRLAFAVPLGVAAANTQAQALQRLSLGEAEYHDWRHMVASRGANNQEERLAEVRIVGLERVSEEYVVAQIKSAPGSTVDLERISRDTDKIYALGEFEQVSYQVSGEGTHKTLEIKAVEKEWGPDYIIFDLGMYADTAGDFEYLLSAKHRRTWLNRLGGEWRNTIQIGRNSFFNTSFYQPLDEAHKVFIESLASFGQRQEDLFDDGDRVAIYDNRKLYGQIDIGLTPTNHLVTSIGYRYGYTDLSRDTGDRLLREFNYYDAGIQFRSVYDSLNSSLLPTSGWYGAVEYFGASEELGGDIDYDRFEAMLLKPLSIGPNTITLRVGGGTNFGKDIPPNEAFSLGGLRSLPGLRFGELRGQEYWLSSASYKRKILGKQSLFGNALYGGVQLSSGQMTDFSDEDAADLDDSVISAASLLISGKTPIGPLDLVLGFTDSGDWNLAFSLGRPIDENNLFGRTF